MPLNYAIGPLQGARQRYEEASKILHTARLLKKTAPESLQRHADIMIKKAEFYVGMHLENLWVEQCREVFNDSNPGWFQSEKCRKAINAVDWKNTGGGVIVFKDYVEGL